MLKVVLLSTAALALVATAADARPQMMFSKDNRFVSVTPGRSSQATPSLEKKITYVYSTISKNNKGAYFCCYGSTISGPSSSLGAAYGAAEQFILSSNATISNLAAGVGYFSGSSGDHTVTLTLYADNGSNSPGKMLAQGTGAAKAIFGFCCGVTHAKISSTKLTAGTPYWVAVTTTGVNEEAAGFQVSNEVDGYNYNAYSSDGGSTWGSGFSLTEYNMAIGVY